VHGLTFFAADNIKVGKLETAKDALQFFLSQRRLNKQWTDTHEALAMKFVNLAVDLRQAFSSKDGIIHYRNLTQQVCILHFERLHWF
jgi:superoxide dismutase